MARPKNPRLFPLVPKPQADMGRNPFKRVKVKEKNPFPLKVGTIRPPKEVQLKRADNWVCRPVDDKEQPLVDVDNCDPSHVHGGCYATVCQRIKNGKPLGVPKLIRRFKDSKKDYNRRYKAARKAMVENIQNDPNLKKKWEDYANRKPISRSNNIPVAVIQDFKRAAQSPNPVTRGQTFRTTITRTILQTPPLAVPAASTTPTVPAAPTAKAPSKRAPKGKAAAQPTAAPVVVTGPANSQFQNMLSRVAQLDPNKAMDENTRKSLASMIVFGLRTQDFERQSVMGQSPLEAFGDPADADQMTPKEFIDAVFTFAEQGVKPGFDTDLQNNYAAVANALKKGGAPAPVAPIAPPPAPAPTQSVAPVVRKKAQPTTTATPPAPPTPPTAQSAVPWAKAGDTAAGIKPFFETETGLAVYEQFKNAMPPEYTNFITIDTLRNKALRAPTPATEPKVALELLLESIDLRKEGFENKGTKEGARIARAIDDARNRLTNEIDTKIAAGQALAGLRRSRMFPVPWLMD